MSVPVKRVARVVIAGEWFTVESETFSVEELEFTDNDGNPAHGPLDLFAYRFIRDNGDEYYGPLSELQLIKLKDAV